MVLSQYNGSVEKGFSINKDCHIENMQEETLLSQRIIYDAVKLSDLQSFNIMKPLTHH